MTCVSDCTSGFAVRPSTGDSWKVSSDASFKVTNTHRGTVCLRTTAGRHVERNEECELPSRSAIRIGPFYGVLLLPAKEPLSLTAPLPSFGRAPAGAGGGKTFRPAVSYKQMVTEIYDKLLHEYGWFTVLDMARLARREYPDHNLPDEDEKLKDGIKRYLSKPDSGFDVAGADQVPRPIFDQLSANHMHKQKQWYRRISPEAVAAKVAGDKSKKAAKTAAVGGAAPIASAGQLQLQAAGLGGPGLRAADATAGEAATAGDGAADNIVNISDEDDDAAEGGGDGPAADADDLMYDD